MKYDELISELRSQICKNNCLYCVYMKTGCTPKMCEQAANVIEELQKPKWISVEERLPEQKGFYLVFAHGVIGTAYYGSKWWTEDPRIYEPQITHWMPMLPEPPKEEADG